VARAALEELVYVVTMFMPEETATSIAEIKMATGASGTVVIGTPCRNLNNVIRIVKAL
jgi:hypothetical protein